jgi:predicted enzyme related to lactoylglutathione lyase
VASGEDSRVGDHAKAPSTIDVAVDCADVEAQARFWAEALGYQPLGSWQQYRSLVPPEGEVGPKLVLQQVPEARPPGKNRLHLDLIVGPDIEGEARRLEALGAQRRSDPIAEAGTRWIVMIDPEGNEFCVCET